jgi:hypothetical protein
VGMRRLLGLTEGMTLVCVVEGAGRLVLENRHAIARRYRGMAAGHGTTAELLATRRAEAALEAAEARRDKRAIARAHKAIAAVGTATATFTGTGAGVSK